MLGVTGHERLLLSWAVDGELALHLSTVKADLELYIVLVGSSDIEDAGCVAIPTDAFRLDVREA
jgi:hypothetical protein